MIDMTFCKRTLFRACYHFRPTSDGLQTALKNSKLHGSVDRLKCANYCFYTTIEYEQSEVTSDGLQTVQTIDFIDFRLCVLKSLYYVYRRAGGPSAVVVCIRAGILARFDKFKLATV